MQPARSITNLLEASLERVWNERDDAKRLTALQDLYHPHAVLFEPDNEVVGIEEISKTVAKAHGELPDGFRFEAASPAAGHHGLGLARWNGVAGGRVIVTGSDVAKVADGLVTELHVFFDAPQ